VRVRRKYKVAGRVNGGQKKGEREKKKTHRHHSPRRSPRNKNPALICFILVQRIPNHIRDRIAIGASLMCQRRARRDIPARAAIRRLRVYDDKPVLLRQSRVGGAAVVRLRSARAVVDSYHDARIRGQVIGDVDVHFGVRGVGPEAGHLLQ